MSIPITDVRYKIDSLIAIAKITASPSLRQELLDEALELLRAPELTKNTIDSFLESWEASDKERIKTRDCYNLYKKACGLHGWPIVGKQAFFESLKRRGLIFSICDGYNVIYMQEKKEEQ